VVNNGTQNGRVTVLYFWGTWCIPCRAVSPKVSEIAARFADGAVDVFAPAIRERDAEGPRSYIADNDYKHRLVLGADALATSFKVRVYPTVIVIGPTGEIVYQAHPGPDRTADQMADQIAAAIEGALAN
jgi:thiol-disulfide isomerase/thioredoxin